MEINEGATETTQQRIEDAPVNGPPGPTEAAEKPGDGVDELFDPLIVLNRRAFAAQRYSIAFHTLNAALHWAEHAQDIPRLQQVQRLAGEELAWIDAQAPEYEHSSPAASQRGHVSIYTHLERHASVAIRIVERQQKPRFLQSARQPNIRL